jgi:hypothetical protein
MASSSQELRPPRNPGRFSTIIGLEHENAELKAMLRAHEAQLIQLSRRIDVSESDNERVLAVRTRN